jgi:RNA ligase
MEDYTRLHKIVTGMNPRSIWERLSTGQGVDRMSSLPEHFQKWVHAWTDKLMNEYKNIETRVIQSFVGRPFVESVETDRTYRKRFALYVQTLPQELQGALFAMLDGKDIAPIIWRQIEPRGDDKSFRTEEVEFTSLGPVYFITFTPFWRWAVQRTEQLHSWVSKRAQDSGTITAMKWK